MKRSKVIWIIVIIAAAAAAGSYWFFGKGGDQKITYRTEKIDRGDVIISISATGTLNAVTTVQVGTQVSGTIAKLYADFNSVVREGELLAQLDSTFLKASVNEQRANVERAKAQVNEARRNFDRVTKLSEKLLVAQAEVDAATTSLETAEAGLKQAQASLDRAEVNLRYAIVRAPIDGVVISRNVDVGQTVAASLQAPTLFTIANDLKRMQVEAAIDEADIGTIKVGQKVTFRVDAYPEEQFRGGVSQVRLAPIVSQGVVTYTVIIDVPNPDLKLMPGMTATLSISIDERHDVLRIPLTALKFSPPNNGASEFNGQKKAERGEQRAGREGRPTPEGGAMAAPGPERQPPEGKDHEKRGRVWILENGTPKLVLIVRGIQNSRWAELADSTLTEGTEVIIGFSSPNAQATNGGANNPFAPRMPGMRGGGR